jgi:hypothetical protein
VTETRVQHGATEKQRKMKKYNNFFCFSVTSMLRAAIKRPQIRLFASPLGSSVLGPHAGPVRRWGSVIDPLPLSEPARGARGPLRLMHPDTGAAVPSPFRSRRREQPARDRTRSTREHNARRRYPAFMTAPLGTTPLVAYRHNAITISAPARPCQFGARVCQCRTAPDTSASVRSGVASAPSSRPAEY